MSEGSFSCLAYKLSKLLSSKSLPKSWQSFFSGLISHHEVVTVQLHVEQVAQAHRVTLGVVDAEERKRSGRQFACR